MPTIQLNPDQIALLQELDADLDLALSDGLRDEAEAPISPAAPGVPGYGSLPAVSRQAIRETFRLMFGTYVHTRGEMDTLIDTTSTPGNAEINSRKGRFALDPGSTSVTIFNNRVTESSVVTIVPEDDGSPMFIGFWFVELGIGAFVFHYSASGYSGKHRFVVH